MKIKEGEMEDIVKSFRLYSEDGREGATALLFKNGYATLEYNGGRTSQTRVGARGFKAWARKVAAERFRHSALELAQANLRIAFANHQKLLTTPLDIVIVA